MTILECPVLLIRDETEWVETVESGWNVLVGYEADRIIEAVKEAQPGAPYQDAFGDGKAAESIVQSISPCGA